MSASSIQGFIRVNDRRPRGRIAENDDGWCRARSFRFEADAGLKEASHNGERGEKNGLTTTYCSHVAGCVGRRAVPGVAIAACATGAELGSDAGFEPVSTVELE